MTIKTAVPYFEINGDRGYVLATDRAAIIVSDSGKEVRTHSRKEVYGSNYIGLFSGREDISFKDGFILRQGTDFLNGVLHEIDDGKNYESLEAWKYISYGHVLVARRFSDRVGYLN